MIRDSESMLAGIANVIEERLEKVRDRSAELSKNHPVESLSSAWESEDLSASLPGVKVFHVF